MNDRNYETLSVRFPNENDLKNYYKKCEKMKKKHTDLVREMIIAFNEGRLTITPSSAQQKLYKEKGK
jgi:hypothetical protein